MKKILLFVIAIAAFANAELQSVQFAPEEPKDDGIKALVGFGGGNSMIADDGTIFTALRIGIDFKPLISTGMWYSTIISDVRNYNVDQKQLLSYNAFGAFIELFPVRVGNFAISVPIEVGGGAISTLENGDEGFQSEDYVFIADMALHFNYRITKMLEVSIGGGYRMFSGVEENNLENMDFNTPFGELRFTIRE